MLFVKASCDWLNLGVIEPPREFSSHALATLLRGDILSHNTFSKLRAPPKTATSFVSPQFCIHITKFIPSLFSEFGMLFKYCKETLIRLQVFVVWMIKCLFFRSSDHVRSALFQPFSFLLPPTFIYQNLIEYLFVTFQDV